MRSPVNKRYTVVSSTTNVINGVTCFYIKDNKGNNRAYPAELF